MKIFRSIIKLLNDFYYYKVLKIQHGDCPINDWFELSYAQYLTIPRSALQSMPYKWRETFSRCLDELDDSIDWRPKEGRYWVSLKNNKGKYKHDPLMQYRHVQLPYLRKTIRGDKNGII